MVLLKRSFSLCFFVFLFNGIINFWPFDLNEHVDLASIKLNYKKKNHYDRGDSGEAIVVRGSCWGPYQDFRLHWIMTLLSFAGLLSDRSTNISQITMVFQLLVIILEDRKIISVIYWGENNMFLGLVCNCPKKAIYFLHYWLSSSTFGFFFFNFY